MATLHIIGNGFDLAHGILSTYMDFENTLGVTLHIIATI